MTPIKCHIIAGRPISSSGIAIPDPNHKPIKWLKSRECLHNQRLQHNTQLNTNVPVWSFMTFYTEGKSTTSPLFLSLGIQGVECPEAPSWQSAPCDSHSQPRLRHQLLPVSEVTCLSADSPEKHPTQLCWHVMLCTHTGTRNNFPDMTQQFNLSSACHQPTKDFNKQLSGLRHTSQIHTPIMR